MAADTLELAPPESEVPSISNFNAIVRLEIMRMSDDGLSIEDSTIELVPTVFGDHDSEFTQFRDLAGLVAIGLLIRLVLAPWTSVTIDFNVWSQVAVRGMQSVGLYDLTGFSYPPLYGYWASALGVITHIFGLPPTFWGQQFVDPLQKAYLVFGNGVTTPIGTLLLKLPMIGADLATGWCLWRATFRLGATPTEARTVFLWWFLNPIAIYESSVQGQIDPLAALAIGLIILAVAEESWALVGVALTLGVAAKLLPGFYLFPVIGYLWGQGSNNRLRHYAELFLSGAVSFAILVIPVLGGGLIENLFTRTSVSTGLGGVGLTGLLHLPFETSWLNFLQTNSVMTSKLILLSQIAVAVFAGIRCARSPRFGTFVTSSIFMMAFVLLTNPVTNPQYLLWGIPFIVLGVSGLIGSERRYRFSLITFAIAVFVYQWGLVGVSSYFAPASIYLGWPKVSWVFAEQSFLRSWNGPSWLPPNWDDRMGYLGTMGVVVALIVVTITALRTRANSLDNDQCARASMIRFLKPRRGYCMFAFATVVVIIEIIALVGPGIEGRPIMKATLSSIASAQPMATVSGTADPNIRVTAFPVNDARSISHIVVFQDGQYPYQGASVASVLGVEQDLVNRLARIDPRVTISFADTRQWGQLMSQSGSAAHTLVVDVAGVLPRPIYSTKGHGPLISWLRSGGRMVFAGDAPGYYSVTPGAEFLTLVKRQLVLSSAVEIVGTQYLIPANARSYSNWDRPPSPVNSSLGTALGTTYTQSVSSLVIRGIQADGGAILGHVGDGVTSEAYIPVGAGGVLAFGGVADGYAVAPLDFDIARLVATNWFAHVGSSFATNTMTKSVRHLTLSALRMAPTIEIVATNPNLPLWIWVREIRL